MAIGKKWNRDSVASVGILVVTATVAAGLPASAETVRVRTREGSARASLALKDEAGRTIAIGDILQTAAASGREAEVDLRFRFHDGSVLRETSTFSQDGQFRLLKHLATHKGARFKDSLRMAIDTNSGEIDIDHTDEHGKRYQEKTKLELPPDLANGMIPILLRNAAGESVVVSLLAATPKPRVVKMRLDNIGEDSYSVAGQKRTALRYRMKIEIGGITGVFASILGKTPPDSFMWISGGPMPTFVRSLGPLVPDGPSWAIEPVSPEWPPGSASPSPEP